MKSRVLLKVHWVWIRQKETTTAIAMDSPTTCDAFLLLPCASGASPFSASQQCTMEDCESFRYDQPSQELQGCLGQTKEIICLVPRCLWKGQGQTATRGLLVASEAVSSGAEPGWTRLQLPASQLAVQALRLCCRCIPTRTPDQLVITEQQEFFFSL